MKNKISYLVLGAFLMVGGIGSAFAAQGDGLEVVFDFTGVNDTRAAAFAQNQDPGVRLNDVDLAVHDGHIGILNAANGADLDSAQAIRGVIVPGAAVALGQAGVPAPKHAEMPYGDGAVDWGGGNNAAVTNKLADYTLESWLGALAGDEDALQGIYDTVLSMAATRFCYENANAGKPFDKYLGNNAANKLRFIKDVLRTITADEQTVFRGLLLKHGKGYHGAAFAGVALDDPKMTVALEKLKFGIANGEEGNITINDDSIQNLLRENYDRDGVRADGVLAKAAKISEEVYNKKLAATNALRYKAYLDSIKDKNPGNEPQIVEKGGSDIESGNESTSVADSSVVISHNGAKVKVTGEFAKKAFNITPSQIVAEFNKMPTGRTKDRKFEALVKAVKAAQE